MWGSGNLCGICHLNNSLVGELLYDQNDRSTDIWKLPAWFWVLMLLLKFPKQVVLEVVGQENRRTAALLEYSLCKHLSIPPIDISHCSRSPFSQFLWWKVKVLNIDNWCSRSNCYGNGISPKRRILDSLMLKSFSYYNLTAFWQDYHGNKWIFDHDILGWEVLF